MWEYFLPFSFYLVSVNSGEVSDYTLSRYSLSDCLRNKLLVSSFPVRAGIIKIRFNFYMRTISSECNPRIFSIFKHKLRLIIFRSIEESNKKTIEIQEV